MLVVLRFARRRWTKALAIAYPFLTLTVIVATANHFILDAVGGLVIVGAGYLIGLGFERLGRRSAKPEAVSVSHDAVLVE